MRLVLACAAAFAFVPVAEAQTVGGLKSGQQMLDLCVSAKATDIAACDSFLAGARESFIYLQDIGQIDRDICVPTGTGPAELRQTAVDYWRANPAGRRYSAVSSFWNALAARYPAPCV